MEFYLHFRLFYIICVYHNSYIYQSYFGTLPTSIVGFRTKIDVHHQFEFEMTVTLTGLITTDSDNSWYPKASIKPNQYTNLLTTPSWLNFQTVGVANRTNVVKQILLNS